MKQLDKKSTKTVSTSGLIVKLTIEISDGSFQSTLSVPIEEGPTVLQRVSGAWSRLIGSIKQDSVPRNYDPEAIERISVAQKARWKKYRQEQRDRDRKKEDEKLQLSGG